MIEDFKEYYKEDINQYFTVLKRYSQIQEYDIEGAYKLMQDAHIIAERWSKIKFDIKNASKRGENSALKERIEEMYRHLKEIATTCRVIWKLAKEDLRSEGKWDK